MRYLIGAIAALTLSGGAIAQADEINPGDTVSGITVLGTASIYHIFGHEDPGTGTSTEAALLTFDAGVGNTFTFDAEGLIGCCSAISAAHTPDGAAGSMNIIGANGLSSLTGNGLVPLVAVFTTDTDPFGGAAPAALGFDANNPTGLSPLLNQVFYVGDGRAGRNDAGGAFLSFLAPSTATRLYIGVIDASGFNAPTGFYHDNPGSFSVDVSLTAPTTGAIPEPSTWAMMILGFGAAGAMMRRRVSVV